MIVGVWFGRMIVGVWFGRMIVGVWFGRMICTYGFAGARKLLGVRSAKQGRVKHESIPP